MTYITCPACKCKVNLKVSRVSEVIESVPVTPKTLSKYAEAAVRWWLHEEWDSLPKGGPMSVVDYYSRYLLWAGRREVMLMTRRMFSTRFIAEGAVVSGGGEYRKYSLEGAVRPDESDLQDQPLPLSDWQIPLVAEKDVAWIQVLKMDIESSRRVANDPTVPEEERERAAWTFADAERQLEWSRENAYKVPEGMKSKGWWS